MNAQSLAKFVVQKLMNILSTECYTAASGHQHSRSGKMCCTGGEYLEPIRICFTEADHDEYSKFDLKKSDRNGLEVQQNLLYR